MADTIRPKNYTDEMVAEMHELYTANPTRETVDMIAENFGKSVRSVIAKLSREIDGGKENLSANFPLVIAGQKGLVAESQLRIPNMRGIMQARTKSLQVVDDSNDDCFTVSEKFEKPVEKSACKLVESGNEVELVRLLQEEAKVI